MPEFFNIDFNSLPQWAIATLVILFVFNKMIQPLLSPIVSYYQKKYNTENLERNEDSKNFRELFNKQYDNVIRKIESLESQNREQSKEIILLTAQLNTVTERLEHVTTERNEYKQRSLMLVEKIQEMEQHIGVLEKLVAKIQDCKGLWDSLNELVELSEEEQEQFKIRIDNFLMSIKKSQQDREE